MNKIEIKEKLSYFEGLLVKLDSLGDSISSFVAQAEIDVDNINGRSTCWSLETFEKPTPEEIKEITDSGDTVDPIGGHLHLTLGEVNNQMEGPEVILELTYEQVDEILNDLKPKKSHPSRASGGFYGPDNWADKK
jgi:hypothetical protein